LERVLDPKFGRAFLHRFLPFQRRIARAGMLNSLVQVTLKLTVPGVPDLYQGTELWDFSLVDPDNRRPVDYAARLRMLATVPRADPATLRREWPDGRIKFFLTQRLLEVRRQMPDLFESGDYQLLDVTGAEADRVCAFARSHGDDRLIVVVGRHFAGALKGEDTLPEPETWGDTAVLIPAALSGTDVLTGAEISGTELRVADLLSTLPVAVILAR
jgi:(1->4)-alpha-D-glucan 1-alpha-D-glucosylmutase